MDRLLSVTKGQWFPITLSGITYSGAAFNAKEATGLAVSLVSIIGTKYALTAEATAINEFSCVCDGGLSAGKYYLELSCTGTDGKAYRLKSSEPILSITEKTEASTSPGKIHISGDGWELTADAEIHEGQTTTYMALLETARQNAIAATKAANDAATHATSAAEAAETATANADKATADAETATSNANKATEAANTAAKSVDDATAACKTQTEACKTQTDAMSVMNEKLKQTQVTVDDDGKVELDTAFPVTVSDDAERVYVSIE